MTDSSTQYKPWQGVLALTMLCISTLVCFVPVLIIGLLKLIPIPRWKAYCAKMVDAIAVLWTGSNNLFIQLTQDIEWDIRGLKQFNRKNNYLLIANHQSWLDIVVLQRVFNRKIPVLKFFIKNQLKWVPFLGFAWWAMGCPFMKRYSSDYLQRKPHKKGKDIKATRKALELFQYHPASLINFVEGTRFTAQKKALQESPYEHLLRPKAGGVSFVINAMGQKLSHIMDVTIVYPHDKLSLWDFLCHRMQKIIVHINQIPIPAPFKSDDIIEDKAVQAAFRDWLNEHWQQKDKLIAQLKSQANLSCQTT